MAFETKYFETKQIKQRYVKLLLSLKNINMVNLLGLLTI